MSHPVVTALERMRLRIAGEGLKGVGPAQFASHDSPKPKLDGQKVTGRAGPALSFAPKRVFRVGPPGGY